MRSYTKLIAAAVVGVGALAVQPLAGQQRPATQTRPAPGTTTATPGTTTAKPAPAPQRQAPAPTKQAPVTEGAKSGDVAVKVSNNPPVWWYLGKTDEDDMLFMDAANLVEYENGEVIDFRGFFYYTTPRATTNYSTGVKEYIAYETYEAWLNCTDRLLSDEKHAFYTATGKEIVFEETEDTMKLQATPASPMEAAFVCGKERAGGSHKFVSIGTDPLTYVKKK